MKSVDVLPVNQWISVEDKLPIEQSPVLCYARSTTGECNYRILGTLRNEEFWFLQVNGTQLSFPCLHLKVTHWMPLPEPPKDGDEIVRCKDCMKHGTWYKEEQGYDTYVECSECGLNLSTSNYIENEWQEILNYCPNCGTRMNGEQNDKT